MSSGALAILLAIPAFVAASARPTPSPHPTTAPTPTPVSTTPAILVPRGTIVVVLVTKEIRVGGFGSTSQEHKVKFEIAQDVILAGFVVAKKGDLVEGHYDTQTNQTKRVFSANVSQEVELDVDDLVNFCGDTIHLEFARTFVGGGREGVLSFGPHAHDAVFSKGATLKAASDRPEKDICAEATTATPAPLPSDVVLPDSEVTPSPAP